MTAHRNVAVDTTAGGSPARPSAEAGFSPVGSPIVDRHQRPARPGVDQPGPPTRRDRLGTLLLSICALGAIASAVAAVDTVSDTPSATEAVETWRLVGYAYFAGVFVLLALAPRHLRGLWEITIVAKLALPMAGATFLRGSADAGAFVVFDGIVTTLLIAAYVSMRGWTALRPHRWPIQNRRDVRAGPPARH